MLKKLKNGKNKKLKMEKKNKQRKQFKLPKLPKISKLSELSKSSKLPKLPKFSKLSKLVEGIKEKNPKDEGQKNRKSMSIKYKLIGSLVLFASLPVIIVSILSAQANTKAIENSVGSYSQKMVEQFAHTFDGFIGQTRDTLTDFMLHKDLHNSILAPRGSDQLEEYRKDQKIDEEIQLLLNANRRLNGVIVANNDNRVYSKNRYDAIKEQLEVIKGNDVFSYSIVETMKSQPGPLWFNSYDGDANGIYLGWYYTGYHPGAEGIVIASVDTQEVQKLIDVFSIEDVSEFYIIDENRNIVIAPEEENIGQALELAYIDRIFGEEENGTFVDSGQLISYYTFENGWKGIYNAPLSVLMADVTKAKNKTIIVAIVCILLALTLGTVIATSISKPIHRLSQVMAEAETGNLAVEYTFDSDNEIGRLVRSFNQMINNIKALVLDTKTVAETIESNTETLQIVSESTATSSNQITQAIESIATGTESQTIQIVQSSQMMENLSHNINLATDKAQDVQEVADNTMRVSNDTVSTMEELTVQSEKTIEISSRIEKEIEELGAEASQITNVIGMIQSISEQTNLLALNATIEAARAGDAGRGFGVVADEIRKLANQSKEATSKIEDIIISIMKKKDTSIEGARAATSLIALQRPIVENTNEAFEKIHSEMEMVVTQLDELRELFGEITKHKDETVVAISEISDIIGHSASAAEEVFATSAEQSTSAESIADMSNVLLKGVEELKAAQQKFRL